MNLDTFTGHLKLSDSYRKALAFIVYPLIAALSLCLGFFYYCAFKASAIGLPGLWLSVLPLIACLFVGVLLLIKEPSEASGVMGDLIWDAGCSPSWSRSSTWT